jgi:hypothetical protein
MLEMMFFYDGKLTDIAESEMESEDLIDAGDGYTSNMKRLGEILRDGDPHMVITNQIELLNNTWLWDTKTHTSKLCLKDERDGHWKPIGRFTKRDLKNGNNLAKMYMNGEFAKKSYPKVAKREPRDLIRFRLE